LKTLLKNLNSKNIVLFEISKNGNTNGKRKKPFRKRVNLFDGKDIELGKRT
jgi:hypothetical protein